jgi:hypothetical protein
MCIVHRVCTYAVHKVMPKEEEDLCPNTRNTQWLCSRSSRNGEIYWEGYSNGDNTGEAAATKWQRENMEEGKCHWDSRREFRRDVSRIPKVAQSGLVHN